MRERGLPRAAGCEPDGLPRAGRWQHAAVTGLPEGPPLSLSPRADLETWGPLCQKPF